MSGIWKSYAAVRANRGASLEVGVGEIHALVGENGAGKSTLMRMLAGLFPPDAGRIAVNGRDVTGWSAASAIRAGVGMVHQHFMLIPTLTIAENVVLGREPMRGLALDMAKALIEVRSVAEQFGFTLNVRERVRDLSVGEAQRVEILKALFRGARMLILDEPTAVLSPPEVQELWRVLRSLRADGGTIILITHKLDEVMDVSDHITVLRHGETVATMLTTNATPAGIARAMVARDVVLVSVPATLPAGAAPPARPPLPAAEGASRRRAERAASLTLLQVQSLTVKGSRREPRVRDLSLTVSPGEILGIAGVEGNGQTELVEAIAGLRPVASGSITLGDHDITALHVHRRAALGLAHIPEDRHRRGLILDYSVADNLILGRQASFAHHPGGTFDRRRVLENARERIARFDIRPVDPALPARALSGGNQQKIVVAREMGGDFSVLLAAQPTRGVDVGAIEFIHAQLRAARDAGKAILLVSAELAEILALADRVAVMYGGRIVGLMSRAEASVDRIGKLMTGALEGAAVPA
ncbi:MAG TPA: ABC transporter ATP-binding protein [Gemmatimonadaceae bacterium]|nr:ABC transporter ATP-binding protein [Gemmatimonadaceae bacterium]